MERVVTINLNGNPYQLEEPAYDALRAYLDRARAALGDNPDQGEIVRDLEQAIADKCASYLSASKTVVAAGEMTRIIEEMGPVEGEAPENAPRAEAGPGGAARRRLYRVKDGAVISGVCTGIGAYFDLDANIVRLLFIVSALFTGGATVIVYIAMMFLVPSAHTSAEWAEAHGVPFNAQEVIDRAKREYARFADESGRGWRAHMRERRRAWREQMRSWRYSWRQWDDAPAPPAAQPAGYVTRVFAGFAAFILSLITVAMLIAFLVAFFTVLNTGALFGWEPPLGVPLWLVLVILALVYGAISAPFRALRRASFATVSGYRYGRHGADGLMMLLVFVVAAVAAWHAIPEARELMQQGAYAIRDFSQYVAHQLR
ncbi:MAG: PspC domain-containing protein [Hyphomonadaceae bacterium]